MNDFLKGVFYLTATLVMVAFLFVVSSHIQNIEKQKADVLLEEISNNKSVGKKSKYTLQELDGRIFLLDNQTGAVWRYYFNSVEEQGWTQTIFRVCSIGKYNYYRMSAEGELISNPE